MDMAHKYFLHSLTVVFIFELSYKLLLIVALFCIFTGDYSLSSVTKDVNVCVNV